MKSKNIPFILCLGLLLFTNAAQSKNIKALFSYYTFNTPDQSPYVETHLSVSGRTVQYKKQKNGKFQGSIGITLIYKQEDKVIEAFKYNLLSPEVADTSKLDFNFIDEKRSSLSNGKYILELKIVDNNDSTSKASVKQDIVIDFEANKITMSDILLLESFTKAKTTSSLTRNGYDMVPFVDNFLPTTVSKLTFYNEIYNTQNLTPNESYILSTYLQNADGANKLGSFTQTKKVLSKDVIIILNEYDISTLPSGNYYIVIELRNKSNEIVSSKSAYFQRSNKSLGKDLSSIASINEEGSFASKYTKAELEEHIKSLRPISNSNEVEYVKSLLTNSDEVQMRKYLIYFWQKRDAVNYESEWANYEKQVKIVNENYSSRFSKGYDTDRGIVFLKYGPPNNIRKNDFDNRAYPYEIWQYFKINQFSNRRFVFFSPDNIKNEMVLLHSNMFGERNDPNWKYKIMARTMKYSDDASDENADYYGKRLDEDYNE